MVIIASRGGGGGRGPATEPLGQEARTVRAEAAETDWCTPVRQKVSPKRSVPHQAEMDSRGLPSDVPQSGYYAGELEDRWTILLPRDSARICPCLEHVLIRTLPTGE